MRFLYYNNTKLWLVVIRSEIYIRLKMFQSGIKTRRGRPAAGDKAASLISSNQVIIFIRVKQRRKSKLVKVTSLLISSKTHCSLRDIVSNINND